MDSTSESLNGGSSTLDPDLCTNCGIEVKAGVYEFCGRCVQEVIERHKRAVANANNMEPKQLIERKNRNEKLIQDLMEAVTDANLTDKEQALFEELIPEIICDDGIQILETIRAYKMSKNIKNKTRKMDQIEGCLNHLLYGYKTPAVLLTENCCYAPRPLKLKLEQKGIEIQRLHTHNVNPLENVVSTMGKLLSSCGDVKRTAANVEAKICNKINEAFSKIQKRNKIKDAGNGDAVEGGGSEGDVEGDGGVEIDEELEEDGAASEESIQLVQTVAEDIQRDEAYSEENVQEGPSRRREFDSGEGSDVETTNESSQCMDQILFRHNHRKPCEPPLNRLAHSANSPTGGISNRVSHLSASDMVSGASGSTQSGHPNNQGKSGQLVPTTGDLHNCPVCGKGLKTKTTLRNHMMKLHGISTSLKTTQGKEETSLKQGLSMKQAGDTIESPQEPGYSQVADDYNIQTNHQQDGGGFLDYVGQVTEAQTRPSNSSAVSPYKPPTPVTHNHGGMGLGRGGLTMGRGMSMEAATGVSTNKPMRSSQPSSFVKGLRQAVEDEMIASPAMEQQPKIFTFHKPKKMLDKTPQNVLTKPSLVYNSPDKELEGDEHQMCFSCGNLFKTARMLDDHLCDVMGMIENQAIPGGNREVVPGSPKMGKGVPGGVSPMEPLMRHGPDQEGPEAPITKLNCDDKEEQLNNYYECVEFSDSPGSVLNLSRPPTVPLSPWSRNKVGGPQPEPQLASRKHDTVMLEDTVTSVKGIVQQDFIPAHQTKPNLFQHVGVNARGSPSSREKDKVKQISRDGNKVNKTENTGSSRDLQAHIAHRHSAKGNGQKQTQQEKTEAAVAPSVRREETVCGEVLRNNASHISTSSLAAAVAAVNSANLSAPSVGSAPYSGGSSVSSSHNTASYNTPPPGTLAPAGHGSHISVLTTRQSNLISVPIQGGEAAHANTDPRGGTGSPAGGYNQGAGYPGSGYPAYTTTTQPGTQAYSQPPPAYQHQYGAGYNSAAGQQYTSGGGSTQQYSSGGGGGASTQQYTSGGGGGSTQQYSSGGDGGASTQQYSGVVAPGGVSSEIGDLPEQEVEDERSSSGTFSGAESSNKIAKVPPKSQKRSMLHLPERYPTVKNKKIKLLMPEIQSETHSTDATMSVDTEEVTPRENGEQGKTRPLRDAAAAAKLRFVKTEKM